jgi:two-component system NtrC family response regulator
MIATCAAMNRVFHLLDKVAGTDVPVLITGPSGTGKEMVAQAIHRRSLLAAGPFVPINCGAIPRELLESELFGHEKGSFTGAYRTVVGTVERAQGGTLFLDEVGELPLELQVKLLRFLQEHTFQRVGGRELLKVNLRVVSATNTPLADLMASGRFREDLYYRLDVVNIDLPPLMDREEDVLILSLVFLKRYARQMGKEILGYTRETPAYLQSHSWPGNIRELINRVRRAVILADGPWVGPEHLGFPASHRTLGPQFEGLSLKEARQQFESRLLAEMLQRCQGNARQAAQVLKVSRSVMYHLIQKYSLKNHLHPGGRSS